MALEKTTLKRISLEPNGVVSVDAYCIFKGETSGWIRCRGLGYREGEGAAHVTGGPVDGRHHPDCWLDVTPAGNDVLIVATCPPGYVPLLQPSDSAEDGRG